MKKLLSGLLVFTIATTMTNTISTSYTNINNISNQINNKPKPTGYFTINHHYYQSGVAYLSSELKYEDDITYSIIKYGDYAQDWDDFVDGYGNFILYFRGLNIWASSQETFGRTSKDYANLVSFGDDFALCTSNITVNNTKDNPYSVELFNVFDSKFWTYEVSCESKLDFWIDSMNKELKIRIYSRGYLWSVGNYSRYLELGSNLQSCYFIPNS